MRLGVILADNPNGTLAFRDELVCLLKTLDREEHIAARGFFLTAWNGTSGYTFDRIIRGKTHIEAVCLSLLGSTQPGRLAEYMRGAISGGAGDDGMVQRFSLVWPDQSPSWENTDRYPASEPRTAAWQAFRRLDELMPESIGAAADEFAAVPYLRFDDTAQGIFGEWRQELETKLRSGDMTPALESHLAKYRKLVPALALINHLADDSDLTDGFTARDIYRNHWAVLSDRNQTQAGLDFLCDFDWLRAEKRETGRASVSYRVNPRAGQSAFHTQANGKIIVYNGRSLLAA